MSAIPTLAQQLTRPKQSVPLRQSGGEFPGGAFARLGTPQSVVTGRITTITPSPDGRWLAVISQNRASGQSHIALLDARSRALVRTIAPIQDPNSLLRFSHDSLILHSSQQSWSVATGAQLARSVEGTLVGVSPNGKFLVVIRPDGRKVVWDAVKGGEVATLESRPGRPTSRAAVTDDGKYVARVENFQIRIDDLVKKTALEPVDKRGLRVQAMPGAARFFAEGFVGGRAAVIDATNGKTLQHFGDEGKARLTQAAVSHDGRRIAAVVSPGVVRVWQAETGEAVTDLPVDDYEIQAMAYSADNRMLFASGERPNRDSRFFAWDTEEWADASVQTVLAGPLRRLLFSPDGRWLAADSVQGKIYLWNVADRRLARTFVADASFDLQFSPDGWLLGAAGRRHLYAVWEVESGDQLLFGPANPPPYSNTVASFSPQLDWLAVNRGSQLIRLKITMPEAADITTNERGAIQGPIYSLTHSPDGRFLVGTSDRPVSAETAPVARVEIATGKVSYPFKAFQTPPNPQHPLPRPTNFYRGIWSPDGATFAATDDRRVINLWDAHSGQYWHALTSEIVPAFSLDGSYLAGFGRQTLTLYEVHSGEEVFSRIIGVPPPQDVDRTSRTTEHNLPDNGLTAVAISPDSRILAGAFRDDDTILLWNLASHEVPARPPTQAAKAKPYEEWWSALRGEDARAAYTAIWRFALAGDNAIAFLKEHVSKTADQANELDPIVRHVRNLDSDQAAVRKDAAQSLRSIDAAQWRAIEETMWVVNRVRQSPETMSSYVTLEQLARLRTIAALERNGSPAAAEVLESLAQGADDLRETWFARSALERLKSREVQ
jgi:WD40 repeat protein